MRRYVIVIIIGVFMAFWGYAQDVKFGIRGGLNLPNLMTSGTGTPVSEGYKSRLASGAGIFTELQLNHTVSLRFGVEYSGMGGKKNGLQAMPTQRLITEMGSSLGMGVTEEQIGALMGLLGNMPQYYYANVNNTAKFDYFMIPLLAQFGKNIAYSPWRVYVNVGPFASFLLSGNQVSEGKSYLYSSASGTTTLWDIVPNEAKLMVQMALPEIYPVMQQTLGDEVEFSTNNITSELKSSNFGVTGNVGIRYQHKRNYFFVEVGGNYGFFAVQESNTNGSNRIGPASVMVGYAFSLF